MWLLHTAGTLPLVGTIVLFAWHPFARTWRWRFVPGGLLLLSVAAAILSISTGVRPALEVAAALLFAASATTSAFATLFLRPAGAALGAPTTVRLFEATAAPDPVAPPSVQRRAVVGCVVLACVALTVYVQWSLREWYPPAPGVRISRTGDPGFAIEVVIGAEDLTVMNGSAQGWSACEMGIGKHARYRTVLSLGPRGTVHLPYDVFYDAEREVTSHGYWHAREAMVVACNEDGGRRLRTSFN